MKRNLSEDGKFTQKPMLTPQSSSLTTNFLILEDLAPLKAITVRKNYAPWLTEELKELQSERNGLHSQARLTRREEDWTKWKRFRNDLGTSSGRQKRNTTSIT